MGQSTAKSGRRSQVAARNSRAVMKAANLFKRICRQQQRCLLRDQAEVKSRLRVYVPLECSFVPPLPAAGAEQQQQQQRQQEAQRLPLSDLMEALLPGRGILLPDRTHSPLLLIQGAAGSGKTLLGWRLCQAWQQQRQQQRATATHLPLVVSLPMYRELLLLGGGGDPSPARGQLLPEFFKRSFPTLPIADENVPLLYQQGFVFILDGLDELGERFPLYTECQLHLWPNSLFVVTTRTGFLPPSELRSILGPQFQQLHLLPFSAQQVSEYIAKFAASPYNEAKWQAADYESARERMPALRQLGNEPLTLFLTLHLLPRLTSPPLAYRLDPRSLEVAPAAEVPHPFPVLRRLELVCSLRASGQPGSRPVAAPVAARLLCSMCSRQATG